MSSGQLLKLLTLIQVAAMLWILFAPRREPRMKTWAPGDERCAPISVARAVGIIGVVLIGLTLLYEWQLAQDPWLRHYAWGRAYVGLPLVILGLPSVVALTLTIGTPRTLTWNADELTMSDAAGRLRKIQLGRRFHLSMEPGRVTTVTVIQEATLVRFTYRARGFWPSELTPWGAMFGKNATKLHRYLEEKSADGPADWAVLMRAA